MKAVLKNKTFIFNNWNYFTASSEDVKLGSYGEKRVSIVKPSYLCVHRNMNLDGVEVHTVDPISFDFSKTHHGDFELSVPIYAADVQLEANYENFKSGKLVLLKLSTNLGTTMDLFNAATLQSQQAIGELKKMKRPRIANQVFVVVSAEFASKFKAGLILTAKTNIDKLEISGALGGGSSSENTLTVSQGTVLAYGLLQPIFPKPKASAMRIDKVMPDQQGMG